MRFSVRALLASLLLCSNLAIGPAAALGLSVEFPTLTWPIDTPVTTPAPTINQPNVDCPDPASVNATRCPAPSR